MAINYVKFLRGTPQAFENLAVKDGNTLYFVSERDSDSGLLYLGDKLIGDGAGTSGIDSLKDISISDLKDGEILVYDSATEKWVNTSVADGLQIDDLLGASEANDGYRGLVPTPKAGDQGKFLRGDGTWAEYALTETQIENIVESLSEQVQMTWEEF